MMNLILQNQQSRCCIVHALSKKITHVLRPFFVFIIRVSMVFLKIPQKKHADTIFLKKDPKYSSTTNKRYDDPLLIPPALFF
jgi:hypothetical protein